MAYALTYAAASHVGLIRGNNEDSAYAGPHLLALADGMGGHAAGEIASQLMISHIAHVDEIGPDDDMCAQLAEAMADGNAAIANQIDINPATDGMGCTLDAFLFHDDTLAICHVGDSRGYRLRNNKLEQITRDDTYVQSLVDEGQHSPEDVSNHPQRSLILKALTGRPVEPTLMYCDVQPGDRYLLCSDGLSDPVSHDTIQDILSNSTLDDAAERLIDLALRSGGPDNVTVVLGDIVDDTTTEHLPTTPVLVGALDPEQTDIARPDTAAGRAVGMKLIQQNKKAQAERRIPQEQPNTHTDEPEDTPKDTSDTYTRRSSVIAPNPTTTPPTRSKKRRRIILTSGIIALTLALLIGGGLWWAKSTLDTRYYIADDNQELVVYKGTSESIFGQPLHHTYQRACLDAKGNLTLLDANSAKECHRFHTTDLPPSVRATIKNLPSGSYDDVQSQMERLAKQALPTCVTRESSHGKPDNPDTAADTPQPGDLTTPGDTCREVK